MFLHIPIARLIIMSILSFGLYEIYWIYKNWKYLEKRDGLFIRPFWRAWFGVFYCHSLLKSIHGDVELNQVAHPKFSAGPLATGWVLLIIIASAFGRSPGATGSIISAFIPSFLCLAPVQSYINEVNRIRNPATGYSEAFSWGHVICAVWGIIVWAALLSL